MSIRRVLLTLAACAVAGCIAPWRAVVKYSSQRAIQGENLSVAVYRAALPVVLTQDSGPIALLPTHEAAPVLVALTTTAEPDVPGHWADTIQLEVRAALADSALLQDAPAPEVRVAAAALGRELITDPKRVQTDVRLRLRMSRPGFNPDSTIAAVRLQYFCGIRCAGGLTLFLARRPGYEWRVWHEVLHWIS